MTIYHLCTLTSLDPKWLARFNQFWKSIKDSGIKTDEKVLYLDDESQTGLIYSKAEEFDVTIKLIPQTSSETNDSIYKESSNSCEPECDNEI